MELREKAEKIFAWGLETRGNDITSEPWRVHSQTVARVAETIAEKCGMDTNKAYAMGLLHDIGKYVGHADILSVHIIRGYEKMMEEREPEIAKICMTHSFCPKEKVTEMEGGDEAEIRQIREFVEKAEYDDFDRLIQLSDYLAGGHGVTSIERRFCSVLVRHGMKHPREDLEALLELKKYFDKKCKVNIYELFGEEIKESALKAVERR